MFSLKKLTGAFTGSVAKVSGRKDFLEAVCAASALIAIADGEIEEQEIKGVTKAVMANANLASFDTRTIELTAENMFKRAEGGRVGRMGLWKEIEDISSDIELAEIVFATALDIAESDGQIEEAEQKVLDQLAQRLHVDAKKFSV